MRGRMGGWRRAWEPGTRRACEWVAKETQSAVYLEPSGAGRVTSRVWWRAPASSTTTPSVRPAQPRGPDCRRRSRCPQVSARGRAAGPSARAPRCAPRRPASRAWPPARETWVCLLPSGRSRVWTRNRAMESRSGTRASRALPRERDPDRRPRERPRDRPDDRRRERNGEARRDGDRRGGRGPRPDRHRDAGHRAAGHGERDKPRQSRERDGSRGAAWDAAPPPWPAPWETPEPPPHRKEGLGRRAPER